MHVVLDMSYLLHRWGHEKSAPAFMRLLHTCYDLADSRGDSISCCFDAKKSWRDELDYTRREQCSHCTSMAWHLAVELGLNPTCQSGYEAVDLCASLMDEHAIVVSDDLRLLPLTKSGATLYRPLTTGWHAYSYQDWKKQYDLGESHWPCFVELVGEAGNARLSPPREALSLARNLDGSRNTSTWGHVRTLDLPSRLPVNAKAAAFLSNADWDQLLDWENNSAMTPEAWDSMRNWNSTRLSSPAEPAKKETETSPDLFAN